MSKRTLSLSTLNISINDPTQRSDGGGERDSRCIDAMWQHALETLADMQQRTFKALLNMTSSDSRDPAADTSKSWTLDQRVSYVRNMHTHQKQEVHQLVMTKNPTWATGTNQSRSLLPQTWSFRMYTRRWLEDHEQGYKMTSPGVFLHDRLHRSNDRFTDALTVMTFIVWPPFWYSFVLFCLYIFYFTFHTLSSLKKLCF